MQLLHFKIGQTPITENSEVMWLKEKPELSVLNTWKANITVSFEGTGSLHHSLEKG